MYKAVTRIIFGGCHVELECHRREDRAACAEGVGSGEGVYPPTQKIFASFISKWRVLCMPAWISVSYFFTIPSYAMVSY